MLVFITATLTGCTPQAPALENFDAQAWKEDRYGCDQKRKAQLASLLNQKEKLLALDEMEIVNTLGNPDQHELYTRNQKFYYYFIEPSSRCDSTVTQAKRLTIRFNAVGLAKEINVQ